jgi:DNA modification methylase
VSIAILRGDARSLPLPDECADLIVCSPPYWALRSYSDNGEHYEGQIGSEEKPGEWLANMGDCAREWVRVLKPSGSLFVNLGDKYSTSMYSHSSVRNVPQPDGDWSLTGQRSKPNVQAARQDPVAPPKSLLGLPWRYALACMDDLGLILRKDIVWHKTNPLPESVDDRCATRHEYIFHFVRQPHYYAAVDEIREPHEMKPQRRPNGHNTRQELGVLPARTFSTSRREHAGTDGHPLGKLPGSVWEIPSQPLIVPAHVAVDHYAAFPFELPRRCILGWSPPAICLECGQGRWPVAQRSQEWTGRVNSGRAKRQLADGIGLSRGHNAAGYPHTKGVTTITGYACSCTAFTDHPPSERASNRVPEATRPLGDYARKQAGEYERVGPWREYHLDGWTAPPSRPALVVDPFGGTGTTALVADVLGRDAITFDRSADYCRLARWRTSDRGERARAMQVPKPPPVPDGQDALFDVSEAPI